MGQNLWYRIAAASLPLLLFPTRVDACVDDSTCGGGQCELGTCTTPVIRNIDHRSIDYFLVAAPTATWDEAGDRCGYVVANGRLARVLYQSEQERLLALSTNVHVLFDGTDKAEEGVWRWSDGTVFYTRAGGCQQAYCGWDGKYPDNSNGIEHHLSMYQTWWNDVSPAAGLRTFFCEVPCTADADCEDDRVLNEELVFCSSMGRCEYYTLDVDVYSTITFATAVNPGLRKDAEISCASLTYAGPARPLTGRLARVLNKKETARLVSLTGATDAWIDGAEAGGTWTWSDGEVFWDGSCQQGFCNWDTAQPASGSYATLNSVGGWVSADASVASRILCEFPCTGDADCTVGTCDVTTGRCSSTNIVWDYSRSIDYFFVAGPPENWDQAQIECGNIATNGRLARILYESENNRLLGLHSGDGLQFDGSDEAAPGTWVWSDGTVFYTEGVGCQQAFCGWQADPLNTPGAHVHFFGSMWTDFRPSDGPEPYFCEVPCTVASDCVASGVNEISQCSSQGRCEHFTIIPGDDITFALSDYPLQRDAAKARCESLTVGGRTGRLARVDNYGEAIRLPLDGAATAIMDGSALGGTWTWTGGVEFWSSGRCQQAYCKWISGSPGANTYLGMTGAGAWTDISGDEYHTFVCEFPCTQNSDCASGSCAVPSGRCESSTRVSYDRRILYFIVESPSASWHDANRMCGNHMPDARLARIITEEENSRALVLIDIWGVQMDGTDSKVEGVWVWSDGTVFYEDGCVQAFCSDFAPGNGGGDYMAISATAGWQDMPLMNSAYLCETPCTSAALCTSTTKTGEIGACSITGRCEYLRLNVGEDITFGISNTIDLQPNAERICSEQTYKDRSGRLARPMSADENARLLSLKVSTSAETFIGGRGEGGVWAHTDGTVIWDGSCRQSYCNFASAVDGQDKELVMSALGGWAELDPDASHDFLCEFPCKADKDCDPLPTCTPSGRCISTEAPPTSVPATSAPATSAPATSAPATSAPATSAPATPAPATSAPATPAPATSAPATSAPATSAPATSAPAAPPPTLTVAPDSQPATRVPVPGELAATDQSMPDEPVPMADLKENGGEEVLIAGTAAGAVAGGSSPGTARLTVLTGRCFIRQEENDLSFLVSPTRLTLSGRNGDLSGCLVGNTALLIAGVVLHLVLSLLCGVAVIRRMFVALTEDRDSKFISRSAWSLMLFALLYQGFCSCGVVLLFHADSVSEVILGIAALASVVVMPFIGLRMIRSVVDENRATYVLDPKSTRWTWVLGAGEWVSLRESSVEQFGCLFQQYLPRTVFFLFIFECSLSLCFACIEAVYVETWVQCGYKKVAFLVANTLYAAQLVRLMPHRLPFANGLELVVNVLTGLGLGTAAAACFSIDPMNHWGAGVSDVTFMFAAYTMLLKSAFCIGILFFVILSKRRVRLAGVPAEPISKIPTTPVTPSHSRAKVVSLTEVAETFPLDDVRDSQSTRGLSPKWSPESELLEPGLHTKSSLSLGLAHGRAPMPRLPRNRSGGSWAASQVSLADSFQLANPNPVLSPQPPRRKSFVYPCSSPSSPKSNAESVLTPLIQPSLPQLVSLHELHNREPQLKPAFPTLHEMPLPL